jgi:hypothetical protein
VANDESVLVVIGRGVAAWGDLQPAFDACSETRNV